MVALAACVVLFPFPCWAFGRNLRKLATFVTEPAVTDVEAYRRYTLKHLAPDHDGNETRLRVITWSLTIGVFFLALQTAAVLHALTPLTP